MVCSVAMNAPLLRTFAARKIFLASRVACGGMLLGGLLVCGACRQRSSERKSNEQSQGKAPVANITGPTDIAITDDVLQRGVKRLGINLGAQNFYDSGQMLKNLVSVNPGFEGETWQTILRCAGATETSCTDPYQGNPWPQDFLAGGTFEFLSGAAKGETGVVTSMDRADATQVDQGVTIHFAQPARGFAADDFVLVKKSMPGRADAGWSVQATGGATTSTELEDLSPHTPGRQALRMTADAFGQSLRVSFYFDSLKDHSFVQMRGPYRLTFRAKGLSGSHSLAVSLARARVVGSAAANSPTTKREPLFERNVMLSNEWRDFTFDFETHESGDDIGTVELAFAASGAAVLLDDVSLQPVSAKNATAFREEVVAALRALQPGILRYQDGDHLGSSLDNLIAPAMARQRAGWSEGGAEQANVPLGLPEFLALCEAVHAEPWFNMPAAMSPAEVRELIDYLAGPATSAYGNKRTQSGHSAPWTSVFPVIHLELGNEQWNSTTFAGAAISVPTAFGQRVKDVYGAARTSPFYDAAKFDMVLGSFALLPDVTKKEMAASAGYDSVAVAPYLFNRLDDDSSVEAIYGPMLAAAEAMDSRPPGIMSLQRQTVGEASPLSVYEVNLGATSGAAGQASFERTAASAGAGLTLADHMLLMLRDLGVKNQAVWALTQFEQGFANTKTGESEHVPLFGTVVDVGGATDRRRPQFLVEQMINAALLPTMLRTRVSGSNPTWDQAKSANGDIELEGAHLLQSFAFADGPRRSLVVLNLSRSQALPITLSGRSAPRGTVDVSQLQAARIYDSNETQENVRIVHRSVDAFDGSKAFAVQPFSMTVLQWTVAK
jgi:hypothetical protein